MNNKSNTDGLISCIIPVFNRQALITECIDSVISQTYTNFEIIIVDDGSTDKTVEVIEKLATKYPGRLQCIRQKNSGPGGARQTGLNKAKGEFIQFLDSDDLIHSKKFELFVNEFNSDDSPDIVFCTAHHYLREEPEKSIVWKQRHHQVSCILPGFLSSRAWSTSTPIYRKCLLDSAGEILPLSCEEDLEYDCRIGLQNPKIKFINRHLTDFRGHKGQRFSVNHPDRTTQLSHQISARNGIYQTIQKSGLNKSNSHVKFFAQSLFLLSRQAAEAGLVTDSNRALEIAQQAGSMLGRKDKLSMKLYKLIRFIAGPEKGSKLFSSLYNYLHSIKINKQD